MDEALAHEWFEMQEFEDSFITNDVATKLSHFKTPDMLKKEVFLILANQISDETLEKWNKTFEELDVEGTGKIKLQTLIDKCKDAGADTKYLELLQESNIEDHNLEINYSDFLAKVIDINKEVNDFDIEKAFKQLDSDNSGKITKENLALFLRRKGDSKPEENASLLLVSATNRLKAKQEHQNRDSQLFTKIDSQNNDLSIGAFKRYLLSPSETSPNVLMMRRSSFSNYEQNKFARS